MRNIISEQRIHLFDKLREIYYEFDSIRRQYWTAENYNHRIRECADNGQTYVSAFRDIEEYLTLEWLKKAIKRSEERLSYLKETIKKEEASN